MSLPDFATPTTLVVTTLDVRGRRSERWLGVLALLVPAVITRLLPLQPITAAACFIVTTTVVAAGLWWHGWLGGERRLTNVIWSSDGRWLLEDGARRVVQATLSADTRVGAHWLWLRWQTSARRPKHRSMLILKGDVLCAELRRLSVRLRLESVFRQSTPAPWAGA